MKKIWLIVISIFVFNFYSKAQVVWSGAAGCVTGAGTPWLTAADWCGAAIPTSAQIAQFGNGATFGTATLIGINMNGATNNGANNQVAGAIEVAASRTSVLSIGNSSGAVAGTLTLNGVTVNAVNNVIIRNNSTKLLTIQANQTAFAMGMALGNITDNIINIDGTGGITISSIIIGANKLTKSGTGTGILVLSGANTNSGGTVITAGTLQLGAAGVLLDAGTITLNGGTLSTGSGAGFSEVVGTLNLSASSTIALGTGSHQLTFANSSGIGWTAAQTLTITGWTGAGGISGTSGQIFAGVGGLTAAQLSQISFTGFPGTPIILASGEVVPPNTSADPIISEYLEGTSNNKCIELYNPTSAAINLANYQLAYYTNGAGTSGTGASPTGTIALAGTLNAGDTYVICNNSSTANILTEADATSASLGFNGDDAIALRTTAGVLIDIVGDIGYDPGTD